MRTPAQQAASRANGAHSRGPKTPEGKRSSAVKPFARDLLAKTTVLKKESRKGFQKMVRQHMLFFAPRNAVELVAVEEICSATWRLHRLRAIERKAIDLELDTQSSPDDLECLLRACGAVAGQNPYVVLQRHESRLQNIITRSIARIEALRRLRPQGKNEASSAPDPLSIPLRPHISIPRRTQEEPANNPPDPVG